MRFKTLVCGTTLMFAAAGRLAALEPVPGDAFETKVDVCFRRDFFCDVVCDLQALSGGTVKIAYPCDFSFYYASYSSYQHYGGPGDERFAFTLEARGLKLRDVLEHLALASGTELDYRGDTVVFWRAASDAVLARLQTQSQSSRPLERLAAVREAAALGDRRIYPILFNALKDADERVVRFALNGLKTHINTLRYGDGVEQAADTLLEKWRRCMTEEHPDSSGVHGSELDFIKLLCATRSKKAAGVLLNEIETVNHDRNNFIARELANTATADWIDSSLEMANRIRLAAPLENGPFGKDINQPRNDAAIVLAGIDDPRACTELMKLLNSDNDFRTQWGPNLLGKSRDPRARDMLLQLATLGVPGAARQALTSSREPRVLDAALNALIAGDDIILRRDTPGSIFREERFVQELLHQAATPQEILTLSKPMGDSCDPRFEDALIAAAKLNDKQWGDRPIWALARIGDERAQNEVMKLLSDPLLRENAILAVSAEPRAEPIVKRALKEGDASLRAALAGGLLPHTIYAFGCPFWTDHVIALLDDPNSQVREQAFKALAQQENMRAIQAVAAYLKNADSKLRKSAAEALSTNADPMTVDPLLSAVADPDESACAAAIRALGGFALGATAPAANSSGQLVTMQRGYDARLVPALLPLIDDKRDAVRTAALLVIPLLTGENDFEKLLPLLHDPRAEVRGASISAFLSFINRWPLSNEAMKFNGPGWAELRKLLPALIRDGDHDVRLSAMSVVKDLNEPDLDAAMVALQNDPDPKVRLDLLEAMDINERFDKHVVSAMGDADEDVRVAAIKLIGSACGEERCTRVVSRFETGTPKERAAILELVKWSPKALIGILTVKDAEWQKQVSAKLDDLVENMTDDELKAYEKATGKSRPKKTEPGKPREDDF
jgi:HEAT repeat protein